MFLELAAVRCDSRPGAGGPGAVGWAEGLSFGGGGFGPLALESSP